MAQFVNSRAVVVLLLASLAVLASAAPKPSNWHVCDKHANYDVVVKNVTIHPDPIISGEVATFIIPAYTEKEITGGSVVVSVTFLGITVHTEKSDLCSRAGCPIAPGEFVLENNEVLPGLTPPGSYRIKLQILGEEGGQLACASISFRIVWSRSVVDTLESFNPIELYKSRVERQAPVAHT